MAKHNPEKGDHFADSYKLKANEEYISNGIEYQTNQDGKITHFSGELSQESSKRHQADQNNLEGKWKTDHAGHLVARENGGSGYVDNLVPMDGKVNTRDYRAFERENNSIMKEGYNVQLDGDVYYSSNEKRPDAFMVTREVKDDQGKVVDREHFSWTNIDMAEFEDSDVDWYDDDIPNAMKNDDYPQFSNEDHSVPTEASKSLEDLAVDKTNTTDETPMVSEEELQYLIDNDYGAVNGHVFDFNDPRYAQEGILTPDWGNDSTDSGRDVVLPEGTRVVQYSHPDQTGTYFAPEGTNYDDLQLPDIADKRNLQVYEVQKGGLAVHESEVAVQPWNKTDTSPDGTGATQYKTTDPASVLVDRGLLKPADIVDPTDIHSNDNSGENTDKGDERKEQEPNPDKESGDNSDENTDKGDERKEQEPNPDKEFGDNSGDNTNEDDDRKEQEPNPGDRNEIDLPSNNDSLDGSEESNATNNLDNSNKDSNDLGVDEAAMAEADEAFDAAWTERMSDGDDNTPDTNDTPAAPDSPPEGDGGDGGDGGGIR